jgi:nucleotide-binding universal stress UspA family protein
MYKHILIATDGSDLSGKAVKHGVKLAKALKARVTGMTSTPTWQDLHAGPGAMAVSSDDYEKEAEARATKVLAAVARAAKKAGVPCATVHVRHPEAWEAIVRTARAKRCDVIVMGSHGRSGMKALVLGSETNKVLAHTRIPVLVHR